MFFDAKIKQGGGTMSMNPQTFSDTMPVAFDDFHKYHNSMSARNSSVAAWNDTVNDFNKNFPGANIPDPNQYRPDLDLSDEKRADMEAQSYMPDAYAPMDAMPDMSWDEKQKFVENKMSEYLSKIPPSERTKYNAYDFFFEKIATAAKESEQKLSSLNLYSSGQTTLGVRDTTCNSCGYSY